jgi:hypothetical protein
LNISFFNGYSTRLEQITHIVSRKKNIRHTVAAGVRDRTGVRADNCGTATVFEDDGKAEDGT